MLIANQIKFIVLLLVSLTVVSMPTQASFVQNDHDIDQLYHNQNTKSKQDLTTRIVHFSAQLLNKPYELGALGEGPKATFDQAPLYRTDAFDCETYVDTVLALAFAENPTTFKQCIRQIRYQNGEVSFIKRNHFTCIDWNKNNQQQGFLEDVTTTITDEHQLPIAKFAKALINKPGWYQHFTIHNIRLPNASPEKRNERLILLKHLGSQLPKVHSTIAYLPLSKLFDSSGKANTALFKQIPQAAVIEIIRPNWDLREKIGTHLNVSHLGFAIWKDNTLMFREASSINGHVIDTPLIEYLRNAQKSPTIKGINIQKVHLQKPFSTNCK